MKTLWSSAVGFVVGVVIALLLKAIFIVVLATVAVLVLGLAVLWKLDVIDKDSLPSIPKMDLSISFDRESGDILDDLAGHWPGILAFLAGLLIGLMV
jgi:uncharacterized membrane protein (Fun14 family)